MRTGDDDAYKLIDLLSRGWDGELTEEDNRAINAFFEDDLEERSQLLLQVSTVHLETIRQIASAKLFERVMTDLHDSVRADVAAVGNAAQTGHSRHQLRGAKTKQGWLPGLGWGQTVVAIAASLLIAIGTWYAIETPWSTPVPIETVPRITHLLRPSRPVASVVAEYQAVWAEGSDIRVGQTIEENAELSLLSGSAQLSMTCGADIVLQAPCKVTLLSHDLARLNSGTLTAHAAEWATGFAVVAKDLKVTDLGTRFAISSDSQGVVEAHVLEGLVLAEPLRQRRPQEASMLLKTGQGIRVNTVRSQVDLIEARQLDFATDLVDFRPLRPIPIWNTGIGAETGASDPHWTITAGSQPHGPYPRLATIQAPVDSYKDNAPDNSQWISLSATAYPGVPPSSVHTFETKFDLTGFDLETVYIVGYFLVDNSIKELRINGYPVEFERWETTWEKFDFKSFHAIEITSHFLPGENTISIDLYNSPSHPSAPNAPNPTALRVEWHAFGCSLPQ